MLKKLMSFIIIIFLAGNYFQADAMAEQVFQADKFPYKEMQIQVMPEFDYPENWPKDQPSLLVGYYGTITNKSGSDFDGDIEFSVPVKEKNFEIYLVAEFPEEKKSEEQRPFQVNTEQGKISWKPGKTIKRDETYKFVIEYYANPFRVGAQKDFKFEYTPEADIEQMDVIVYAPMNAKDFNLNPKATNVSKSEYGEEIHHYQYTTVKQGDGIGFKAAYKKENHESTLEAINKQNPPKDENHQGVDGTATEQILQNSGKSTGQANRPLISTTGAVIIGLSIVIAGAFVFFALRPRKAVYQTSRKHSAVKQSGKNKSPREAASEEKKKLRKRLLNGEIDQKQYDLEMKKWIE